METERAAAPAPRNAGSAPCAPVAVHSHSGNGVDREALVLRFGPELHLMARQLAGNPTDALDLVQDTFERALRKLPEHLALPSIQNWLHVTLRNLHIDLCRSRNRRTFVTFFDEPLGFGPANDAEDEEPRWTQVEPSELWNCVERLSPALREVFLLRNRDARSHAEIALELSIPVSTVGTRCHRAIRHLRHMLQPSLVAEGEPRSCAFSRRKSEKLGNNTGYRSRCYGPLALPSQRSLRPS